MYGADGNDTIDGWLDDDSIQGNSGSDSLVGGSGNDWLTGDTTSDTNSGNDTIDGGAGNDVLDGGLGNDSLVGGEGTNNIYDLAGNDFLVDGYGNDTIDGGADGDSIRDDVGRIICCAGYDYVTLFSAENTVLGGTGDDYFVNNCGSGSIDGGDGFDIVAYQSTTSAVVVSLAVTTAQNTSGAGLDTLVNLEGRNGSNYGDKLTGNALDNFVYADEGNDTVDDGSGNDNLNGALGNDSMIGGDGDDGISGDEGNNTLLGGNGSDFFFSAGGNDSIDGGFDFDGVSYYLATSGVTVSLALTSAQNTGGAGIDTLINVEAAYGSLYNDSFTGIDLVSCIRNK